MANKKPTNKDRDQHLGWLTGNLNKCFNLLGAYIEYKGDEVEFKKFLIDKEEQLKKESKNDTKDDSQPSDKGDS